MQKVKQVFQYRIVVAVLTAACSVAGTALSTQHPAFWRALCMN